MYASDRQKSSESHMANGCVRDCDLEGSPDSGRETASDLFSRYRDKLLRMIVFRLDARLTSKVGGEDVLQDVFVEVVRRIQEYLDEPAVPVFIWLRQITNQILIDTHRKYLGTKMRDVNQEVNLLWGGSVDASSGLLAEQLADSLSTPSQRVVRSEKAAEVRIALGELSPADREVLLLRHLEELGNNEVAEVLGIDKFAASKRYLRALARLASKMPCEG